MSVQVWLGDFMERDFLDDGDLAVLNDVRLAADSSDESNSSCLLQSSSCEPSPQFEPICHFSSEESVQDDEDDSSEGNLFSMESASALREVAEQPCILAGAWTLGIDCGHWVAKNRPPAHPLQVVIANAWKLLQGAPIVLVKKLCEALAPNFLKLRKVGPLFGLLSLLTRLSIKCVCKIVVSVTHGWKTWGKDDAGTLQPSAEGDKEKGGLAGRAAAAKEEDHTSSGGYIFNLAAIAISNAAEGRSLRSFLRDAIRNRRCGARIGDRYLSRDFAETAVSTAGLVLRQLDAADWNRPLPGTGIPSDFAALGDLVNMGESLIGRRDNLNVMCLAISSALNGKVENPVHSLEALPIGGHAGDALSSLMLGAFARHPAQWNVFAMSRRLASASGDGGMVIGGPSARHQSTGACNKLWRKVYAGTAHVPECITWDPFHRVDIAVWRAIRRCPLATTMFDLSKELDYAFGQSEGVVIFRAVAEEVGERPALIKAPGGTRKIGYLSGSPGSLSANFRIIVLALWARVAWTQAGHSTQKLNHLLHMASRLLQVEFVVFLVSFESAMQCVIFPFTQLVQKHLEPAPFFRAIEAVGAQLAVTALVARKLRRLLLVISLCRQHCTTLELKALWGAYCDEFVVAHLPTLCGHMEAILFAPSPTFKGVALRLDEKPNPAKYVVLGAHCQCLAREKLWSAAAALEKRLPYAVETMARSPWNGAVAHIAPWASKAGRSGTVLPSDWRNGLPLPEDVEPRTCLREIGVDAPAGFSRTGMYRAHVKTQVGVHECRKSEQWQGLCPCEWQSRCTIPWEILNADKMARAALLEVGLLLDNMKSEIADIMGKVGTIADQERLLGAGSLCWDWTFLCRERPERKHVEAFGTFAETLAPLMRLTLFPTDSAFRHVVRSWSSEGLYIEYILLLKRVRLALRAAEGDFKARGSMGGIPQSVLERAKSWREIVSLQVMPVWVYSSLQALLSQWSWQRGSLLCGGTELSIAYRVSMFLDQFGISSLPAQSRQASWEAYKSLAHRGAKLRVADRGEQPFQVGDFVHLRLAKECKRKLYVVTATRSRVRCSLVAATLDVEPWFAVGSGARKRDLAWRAVRLHHRGRLLFPPDVKCEGVGSTMRFLWNRRGGQVSPAYFSDCVMLCQAGVQCLGSARDDMIVQSTCIILKSILKNKMNPGRTIGSQKVPAEISEKIDNVDGSGRHSMCEHACPQELLEIQGQGFRARDVFFRTRSKRSRPTDLPEVMRKSVQKAIGIESIVRPLPGDVKQLHGVQKNKTKSVLAAQCQTWVASDAGREWLKERKSLLRADDTCSSTSEEVDCIGGKPPSSSKTYMPSTSASSSSTRETQAFGVAAGSASSSGAQSSAVLGPMKRPAAASRKRNVAAMSAD